MMLGNAKLDDFSNEMVGKETEVLFENEVDGIWEGYSSNYLRVRLKSIDNLKNVIKKVRLNSFSAGKLHAEICDWN
jgi:threonylcarbamoyladenosine tRNA methylthiotransferase MtaB